MVSKRAAHIASSTGSSLLITSYNGWAAFPHLSKDIKKVLFQVHPHPWFLRELYCSLEHENGVSGDFNSESEMRVSANLLTLWGQESLDADLVVATSSFTRESLLHVGVKPERIRVVSYGVDPLVFRNDVASPSGKAKVLFVGQPTSRKGFRNLLEVWKRLKSHHAELHIVSGAAAHNREFCSSDNVIWHERLLLPELVELMNLSDLLVLPSIAEGFGLVLLEALSCGTPILCSDATAGPDLLKGWDQQFVFAAGDWDGLAKRLDHWLTNVNRLRELRSAARNLAESLSWGRFRSRLREACASDPNTARLS
jgi:glycosyltransferase involved in cell wall biosynthesis